jgi:proliferating cell nuclear antigen
LNGISDRIEIKSVGNDLIFSCEGNFASSQIYRSESDGYMEFIQKPDASVIIQGEFSLKSLAHFIKCTPLCSHLEMYLGNDLPLIVKYDVASLGEIKLCLAPLPPS